MIHTSLKRWSIAVALAAMVLGPAQAGPGRDKKVGGSNPTNTAIVDSDLMLVAGTSYTFGTTDYTMDATAPVYSPEMELLLSQPAAAQIRAMEAHQFATGRNVVVAVLDGGFNVHHPAIANNVLPLGYDAVDGDYDVNDFGNGFDDDGDGIVDGTVGHGTFVASMVLMAAPNAMIIPVRVRDDEGYGTNSVLADGIQYAADAGADVINISLEKAVAMDGKVSRELRRAARLGIITVVSAGNDGLMVSGGLADSSLTIAACAVDSYDMLAPWSNRAGDWAYPIHAPGVDLCGAMGIDSLGYWSGTSFSAGLMSGAAALARELHPTMDFWVFQDLMATSVDPVKGLSGDAAGGRINLLTLVTR